MPPKNAQDVSSALAADVATEPAATPPRRWFYTQYGERYGPVTGPELRAAARLEFLGPTDQVRCGDTGPWVRARDVRGLFDRPARSSA